MSALGVVICLIIVVLAVLVFAAIILWEAKSNADKIELKRICTSLRRNLSKQLAKRIK